MSMVMLVFLRGMVPEIGTTLPLQSAGTFGVSPPPVTVAGERDLHFSILHAVRDAGSRQAG